MACQTAPRCHRHSHRYQRRHPCHYYWQTPSLPRHLAPLACCLALRSLARWQLAAASARQPCPQRQAPRPCGPGCCWHHARLRPRLPLVPAPAPGVVGAVTKVLLPEGRAVPLQLAQGQGAAPGRAAAAAGQRLAVQASVRQQWWLFPLSARRCCCVKNEHPQLQLLPQPPLPVQVSLHQLLAAVVASMGRAHY